MAKTTILLAPILVALIGCAERPDERLHNLAQQSLAQQARQSERLVELSQRVADASHQLLTADAQARRELLEAQSRLQQQLQEQQAEVLRQRDALENERRELAAQRGRDPIIAQAIGALGVTLGCLLPLALAAYIWSTAQRGSADAEALVDLLTCELVAEVPVLLAAPPPVPSLLHKPPQRAHR